MKIKAVIFDLDGVIVTTDDCHYRAWKQIADEENIYFDREINERLRGVSRLGSLNILLERADRIYSDDEKAVLMQKKNAIYVELIRKLSRTDILPGVTENLENLKKNGIRIAIGSSSRNTPIILKQIGMDDCFDAVSDGNNITRSKPDPEVFVKAADMLGVAYENCLVVEDADAGIQAGKAAGMMTLAINKAQGGDYTADSLREVDLLELCEKIEKS